MAHLLIPNLTDEMLGQMESPLVSQFGVAAPEDECHTSPSGPLDYFPIGIDFGLYGNDPRHIQPPAVHAKC